MGAGVEIVYRDYKQSLFGYLRRRLREAEALDVLQESFLRYARHGERVHSGKERAWLFAVARNLITDRYREAGRTEVRDPSVQEHPAGQESPYEPDSLYAKQEERACLERQIQRLSPADQDLISMHYHGSLPIADIAAIQGLSEENVKVKLHRARRRLKTMLEEECYGTRPVFE